MDLPIDHIEKLLVESLLSDSAIVQFAQGRIAHKELTPWTELIAPLSKSYNQGQALKISSDRLAKAYALYFTLPNFAKVEALLSEIPDTFWEKPLRILDLGCGPGTASLASLSFAKNISELVLADSSRFMLDLAADLVGKFSPNTKKTVCREAEGKFDLILAANVFNELKESEVPEAASGLLKLLSSQGVIVLLEPALKPATHRAMQIRDQLLMADSELTPLFPCARRDGCPMLKVDPDNWCHWTLHWEQPQLTRQLDELLGFNKHRIKYAGFVFERSGKTRAGETILGEPVKRKYGKEALVCAEGFYGLKVLKK